MVPDPPLGNAVLVSDAGIAPEQMVCALPIVPGLVTLLHVTVEQAAGAVAVAVVVWPVVDVNTMVLLPPVIKYGPKVVATP